MGKLNNRKIITLIFVVVLSFLIYVLKNLIPGYYFNVGKNYYLEKNYKKAYEYLNKAFFLNSKDKDVRYYYVQTLIKLPADLDVQKKLFEFSLGNFSDSADLLADRQISKWRNQISRNAGENYIEQVPFNNKILRWDSTKFPLKVFISNESSLAPPYYEQTIRSALSQWAKSTAGFIKFKFVDRETDSDLFIKIVPSAEMNKCSEENCKYVVAFTTPSLNGDLLKKMTIVFYDSNNLSQPFSQREVYNTALHEMGHALGIMGHSYNSDDLMYMENKIDKSYDKFRSDFQLLSPVDLNTLNLLYKLIPEITNTNLNEYNTTNQIYSPVVLGTGEQINSRKLLEAENYIKSAPHLPNGYIDLASAYVEQKEYNSAIEALQTALNLCTNDSERFIVYYNFAVIYMDIQDWGNSLKYAGLAKQIQPQSAEIDGLIAGINYNSGNKQFAKQAFIDALQKNPQSTIDAVNLSRIYLKEFNFIQAGKTLNKLVEANPQAKNDPSVKPFWILMMLFR